MNNLMIKFYVKNIDENFFKNLYSSQINLVIYFNLFKNTIKQIKQKENGENFQLGETRAWKFGCLNNRFFLFLLSGCHFSQV